MSLIALLLMFMPMDGMGLFGTNGGAGIMVHAFLVNAPYVIVTTLAVAALDGCGQRPSPDFTRS
jgi:hypothetical protein